MSHKKTKHSYPEILLRMDIEGNARNLREEFPSVARLPDDIPDMPKAEIDTALLISYLRSESPITACMRNWLADMLEPNSKTPLRLTLKATKSFASQKKQRRNNLLRRHAGLFAVNWMRENNTKDKDAAVEATLEFYPLGRTTINKAINAQLQSEAQAAMVRNSLKIVHR